MLGKWKDQIKNWDEVQAYQEAAARKSDFERTEVAKDKTGVRLDGVAAVNPVNGKEIPVFISDYVLTTYGTGAIMAVPATIRATGNLRRNLTFRSSKWFRAAMWKKLRSRTAPPVSWSIPAS